MVTIASDNPFPSVLLVEGDPEDLADNPASGQRRLAVGTDHLLYLVDDAGVATEVGGASGLTDPMTTRGDMIIRNASNVTARAAIGSAGKVWTSDGTDPSWQTPSAGGITFSTLGKTSVGASFKTARGVYLHKITLATNGSISAIHAHVKGNGSTNTIGIAGVVYADSSGSPTNLLAYSGFANNNGAFQPNGTARWITIPIGGLWVTGDYWIGIFMTGSADTNVQLAYDTGGATGKYQVNASFAPADSSITTISDLTSGHECSIYADILR